MRINSKFDDLYYSKVTTWGDGSSASDSGSLRREVKRVTRSDIQHNERDITMWRQPSDYSLTDTQSGYMEGIMVQDRRFSDPNDKRYEHLTVSSGEHSSYRAPEPSLGEFWASDNLQNRCEVQALLKARDQKVNLGVAIAEMHKSIDMIASRTMSLYRSYSALRKGNFKGALRALGIRKSKSKTLAEQYLEVQYGWLPLMSDIEGAYDEVRRPFRNHGWRFKVSSKLSERYSTTPPPYFWVPDIQTSFAYKDVVEARVAVNLWYSVGNEDLLVASALGLTNPFEIAWELVPFSFLIDWILPVGNVLGALTATQGLHFMGGTKTLTSSVTRTARATFPGRIQRSDGSLTVDGDLSSLFTRFEMRRTTYGDSPLGRFYFKSPVSTGHALNAIALLRSVR